VRGLAAPGVVVPDRSTLHCLTLAVRAVTAPPEILADDSLAEGAEPELRPQPSRHDFLRAAAALSLLDVLAGYTGRPAPAPGARVDGEMAAGMGNIVPGYRQVYRSAGAASLLGPAVETLGLLTELASSAGAYRNRIISLIGQSASLAGVILMLDERNPAAARRYLAVAVRAARQTGDDELLAVTFGCEAFRAAYSGDTAAGLEYADEASVIAASAGVHPLTRGWTAAVASEVHAAAGDEAGCMRALDAAAEQLEAPTPDVPWKSIGTFPAAKLAAYRGGDLMRLHRYARHRRSYTPRSASLTRHKPSTGAPPTLTLPPPTCSAARSPKEPGMRLQRSTSSPSPGTPTASDASPASTSSRNRRRLRPSATCAAASSK
jgi:hypothetical protein